MTNKSESKDLSSLREQYQQILSETRHESLDPRRLFLLKTQIYQLERQNHNMSLQINKRTYNLKHTQSSLANLAHKVSRWLCSESDKIVIDRIELQSICKDLAGIEHNLSKACENCESVKMEQVIENKYSNEVKNPSDIFNYNVKQMAHLEHELSSLVVEMERLKHDLCFLRQGNAVKYPASHDDTWIKTLDRSLLSTTNKIKSCCYELTLVSLLTPQSIKLRSNLVEQVSYDDFIEYVKKYTRRKEVLDAIKTIWYLAHHKSRIANKRLKLFDSELSQCHRRMTAQTESILEIVSGIENLFENFESEHMRPVFVAPIRKLMLSFKQLQHEESRGHLEDFLGEFGRLLPKLEHVVKVLDKSLSTNDTSLLQQNFKSEMQVFIKTCLATRSLLESEIAEENEKKKVVEAEFTNVVTKKLK